MDTQNRAMTIKEVAEFLNISNQIVYNLVEPQFFPTETSFSAKKPW